MDCGPSTLPALHENKIDPAMINYIYLSHLHPDHWLGLPLLVLDNKWITKRPNPIPIICPPGTEELIKNACGLLYSTEEAEIVSDTFLFKEVDDHSSISLHRDFSIQTIPALHGANGRMALITYFGKTIGYSGDSAFFEPSFRKLVQCEIILHEASTFDLHIPNHTNVLELLQNKDLIKGRMFLTHVDSSVTQKSHLLEPPIFLAEENMKIQF